MLFMGGRLRADDAEVGSGILLDPREGATDCSIHPSGLIIITNVAGSSPPHSTPLHHQQQARDTNRARRKSWTRREKSKRESPERSGFVLIDKMKGRKFTDG